MANPGNEQPVFNAPDTRPASRKPTFDTGARAGNVKARIQVAIDAFSKSPRGSYRHQRIDPNYEIRILRIQHGKDDEPLVGMLFSSALKLCHNQKTPSQLKKFRYTALSYWWGDPQSIADNEITIYKDTGARGVRQEFTPFNKSGTFFIRDNLKAALLRFRHPTEDVNVWVDAICINQDDKIEKTAQVARMHEVYTQAESVCVWLGEGNNDTEPTFTFMKSILDLQMLDSLIAHPEQTAEHWALILKLMTNHWFSRRWVIQELALAREATVRWGNMDLSWRDFADAIALFMTKYEEVKRLILNRKSAPYRNAESTIFRTTDARALGANVIVHATVNLFRKSHEGQIEQRLLPLEILVSSLLLAFEATEPRDTIFAVLMLANDNELSSSNISAIRDTRIFPDYEKCLLDVYADFMDYCIEKSQSLDILCRYWAAAPKAEAPATMPSWIPLIKNSAFGEPHYIVEGRANGDSFVGGPERKGQQVYNASAGLRAWHKFGVHNSILPEGKIPKRFTFPTLPNRFYRPSSSSGQTRPAAPSTHKSDPNTGAGNSASREPFSSNTPKYNGSLEVKGFCVGVISQVSGRVAGAGIIPNDALEMAGWYHRDAETAPVPDKLWRTLVADRGPDGKSPPPWYSRACLECLQNQDREGDLDIPNLKDDSATPTTQMMFLERAQPVVWKRRFFETTVAHKSSSSLAENQNGVISGPAVKLQSPKPLLGLGSPAVTKGDLVCIIFGCSVPVVLRKDRKAKHFTVIGECYLHGMMDGEAIAGRAPVWPYNELEYTTFELR